MCYRPLQAFVNPDGGRPLFGFTPEKLGYQPMTLPCGKCYECRRDHVKAWAIRGHFELLQWPSSLFITLTYDDTHLPFMESLRKRDIQLFMKRIKKKYAPKKIRQIYCGEYGESGSRPHYHVILFNHDFSDQKLVRQYGKNKIYTSSALSKLWPLGKCEFTQANASTIAYVVGYVHKKLSKKQNASREAMDSDGVLFPIEPEFIESSRNPGIGSWIRESSSIEKGFLTAQGQKYKLPKYFMNWLKENKYDIFLEISQNRANSVSQETVSVSKTNKQKELYYEAVRGNESKSKRSPYGDPC